MLSALRYRAGQVTVIALLAALVTTCAAFAPLYDRAMQQAAVAVTLENASSVERDLQIFGPDASWILERTDPEDLVAYVPDSDPVFEAPVLGRNATTLAEFAGIAKPVEGDLWWRAGQCEHVEITAGACPEASREVMVTENEAEAYDLAVGTRVESLAAEPPMDINLEQPETPKVRYEIVGIYRPADDDWWQGLQLDGTVGVASSEEARHDAWLTDESTFSGETPFLFRERSWIGSRLRTSAVGVDEMAAIEADLRRLQDRVEEDPSQSADPDLNTAETVSLVVSSLPGLAERVDAQIEQSRTTVPLLLCQLGLLGVLVLWLMLLAATDQRRPEVVVARLRGRGTAGARSLLIRELLPPVLLGIPPGVGAALLGSWLARSYVLPGEPPFELRRGLAVAVVVAVVVLVLVTYAAAVRVAREPLGALLHRVTGRRPGWRLGAGDAVALAASGAGVVAFLTGSLAGPIALAAPALLSVFVGLVLAHLLPPVAARLGGALLLRGRLRIGVSLVEASRSIVTRRTVALVTVASALAVFSVCGLVVGDRNRALAAEQVAGAPVVAELQSAADTAARLKAVEQVLADVDPAAERVTPVVRIETANGAVSTLSVDPDAFRRIAFSDGGVGPSPEDWAALADGSATGPTPAITSGEASLTEKDDLQVLGLDGIQQEAVKVAEADRIPGDGPLVTVVDLGTALKRAEPDFDSEVSLWFASADQAFLDQITTALADEGVIVTGVGTLTEARSDLDASVATWSLWLGVVVGLAAVLLAVAALTVLTVTGWRTRARDLAALRLAGVDRRIVDRLPAGAQLLPVLVGVAAGAGCGVYGAVLTLPDIPLFAVPPLVDATDLSIPWPAVAVAGLGCLVVLGVAAVVLGRAVAARARLDRLRETT
ncbi:FtsX-like permease family protein [Nocardioides sp. NPDC101246]|uniref:FtsX-like permease family protein n=1 Tax=Nocardioides sp. NPDC101246 TaxID=3364336 RepID=UPI003806A941